MENKLNNKSKYPLPRTMSEFIYQTIKNAILNNELKSNEWINEVKIAENYSVSRTPVREAVRRLAAEGYVVIDSHKKAKVREITFDEVKEIYKVFSILDTGAVDYAMVKARAYSERARNALSTMAASAAKQALVDLTDFVVAREI